ncbi:hypothetical protein AM500_11850 [Bacillus sp. FJAT-18017]|nr:hypothetical protein AM500_11850 [Bacillus sp. FJAT-18017]
MTKRGILLSLKLTFEDIFLDEGPILSLNQYFKDISTWSSIYFVLDIWKNKASHMNLIQIKQGIRSKSRMP